MLEAEPYLGLCLGLKSLQAFGVLGFWVISFLVTILVPIDYKTYPGNFFPTVQAPAFDMRLELCIRRPSTGFSVAKNISELKVSGPVGVSTSANPKPRTLNPKPKAQIPKP